MYFSPTCFDRCPVLFQTAASVFESWTRTKKRPELVVKPHGQNIRHTACRATEHISEKQRWSFSTRQRDQETSGRRVIAIKEKAEEENLKSAKSDHCEREKKHISDWKKAKVIQSESNKLQRWIEIWKRAERTVNRDQRAQIPSHTWGRCQTAGGAFYRTTQRV